MDKEVQKKRKFTESVQFKFIAAFFALIAGLLALLNTYPLLTSRDLVFKEKESALLSQASVVSSSLAALDTLSPNSAQQVLSLLDVTGLARIVVTDGTGLVIYDTYGDSAVGRYALFSELARALDGEEVFWSDFDGTSFVSHAAMPVRSRGVTLGAVYLCEYDAEQAALITGIQSRLRTISIAACAAALALTVLFSRALTARITKLAEAMRVVQDGDYAYRLALTGRDELRELGDEFNSLTERLQVTEEQRRRFVSDASHELKTPLASIRLLSDSILQSDGMDPETTREFVTDIGSEAERLQRTTEKLLNLSRRDDGMASDRAPVDMREVARATLRLLTPLAQSHEVTIETSLEEGCIIRASDDDVYQIIFNLVENAIKYNVAGGRVFLTIRGEEDRVLLIVDDTGIGIPETDRGQIFSRFYRVDKARSRASGGSGLGLSIVHDAVQALGGSIQVSPREPSGTRFLVSFPGWNGEEGRET